MAEKRYYDDYVNSIDESTFLVNDSNFKLPDMGEYYNSAVDEVYMKMVDEAIRNVAEGDGKRARFYLEKPYTTQLGSHDAEGVFFIKAKPIMTKEAIDNGYFDGDTLYFDKKSIVADQRTVDMITSAYDNAINELRRSWMTDKEMVNADENPFYDVGVRFLGIDTPEIPKYSEETVVLSKEDTTSVSFGEAKKRSRTLYVLDRSEERKDSEIVRFIKVGDMWKEFTVLEDNGHSKKSKIRILQDEGDPDPARRKAGLKARNLLREKILEANGEVYFMLDRTSINRSSASYPSRFGKNAFSSGVIDKLLYWYQQITDYNAYRYAGYNQWGQDSYGRFLGTPYVRIVDEQGEKWINLAKYIIAEVPETEVLTQFSDTPLFNDNPTFASNVFKLHTYDFENMVLADAASLLAEQLDDRRKVQREIFNRDFDALKDWTVVIGDTALFVPPTSIRTVSSTTHERMPVIRAKGSITKGAMKEERLIEMTIYFNDERGINGYEYHTQLPNGEEITYYMNGLRSLISQFKFTPFLPIDNHYINEVLNINAVSLVNLQVSTLPDYPRCIAAILTLQEFDYMHYMPELPPNLNEDDSYRNAFAGTINYEVMRWYYQRPILLGQELKNVDVNSQKYLEKTEGHRTALIPMNFKNPHVRFLIANEEHLKKMLQVKLDMIRSPYAKIVLSDVEKEVAKDLNYIYYALNEALGDEEFKSALDKLTPEDDLEKDKNRKIAVYPIGKRNNATGDDNMLNDLDFHYYDFEWEEGNRAHYRYVEKSKINNQVFFDLLGSLRRHMLSVNDKAGKTIISGGTFKYFEENIDKVKNPGTTLYDTIFLAENSVVSGKVTLGIEFNVHLDYVVDPDQIKDLRRDASLATQLQMSDVLKDFKLFIPLHAVVERNTKIKGMPYMILREANRFKLDIMSPDIQFLAYCHSLATQLGYNNDKTTNEETIELKQASDLESLETLVYEDYDIGDVRIKNLSCAFGNVFTRYGLSGTSTYAPQYIGGQDTIIEIGFETTDPYSVMMLNLLPKISTQYARDYRLILPSSPLKIDSEITKLLGVNEVVIENLTIDTVPNHPGLYEISMRLVSMDRTLRNREGLKKINDFTLSGRSEGEDKVERELQTYFEINRVLSEAEIYPDLELPTLDELEKCNFNFIRHSSRDRKYPDPDFYFVYGHVLQSQIFREAVENFYIEEMNEMTWRDENDGEVYTATKKELGVEVTNKNENEKKLGGILDALKNIEDKIDKEKDLYKSKYDAINALRALDTRRWMISDTIQPAFLETSYLSLIDYHDKHVDSGGSGEESAGAWVYDALSPAREASKEIEEYLKRAPSKPEKYETKTVAYYSIHKSGTKDDVDKKINSLLNDDKIKSIFEKIGIEINNSFKKTLKNIVWAAACAATSEKEYSGNKSEGAWKPNMNFIGMRVQNSQDDSGVDSATSTDEAIKYGIEFGPFRTKMYSKEEIEKLLGRIPKGTTDLEKNQSINAQYYLLDPYYHRTERTLKEIEEYKRGTIESLPFATEAFFRLMLFWLKRMIDDNILPSMGLDVLKNEFGSELNKALTGKTFSGELDEEWLEVKAYIKFLDNSNRPVDCGKMFVAAVMALTNSEEIYELMRNRNYEELNGMVQSAMTIHDYSPEDMDYVFLRKFLKALVGLGEIEEEEEVGKRVEGINGVFRKQLNEKKYIKAAEDPLQYIKHSFYDMIVNDKRGRMARAFPTFYMIFVDEGREIGLWKLHDNFYNINSISEIQIAKSRKNPADTCRIVISNLFHTLTTDDEDSNMMYEYDWRDVFTSIFNPKAYYLKEEAKRMKQQPIGKARLTPGTRIHVRMGYGADASALPVLFNGVIAEVSAGEAVEIVAQGDGIQLLNPIMDQTEAHAKHNQEDFPLVRFFKNLFSSATTPKTIIDAFLTVKGGYVEKKLRELFNGYYFNEHPLGITHFGDPNYNVIFKTGEPTQNIYEALNKPKWTNELTEDYSMDEVPKLSIDVFGKTFWDILHICGSVSPDFVVGVAPFGFRSTIFHGHPRYYYAYEYAKDINGAIIEKRKPFQQYHIYTSFSDIIKNDIKASADRVRTNATGIYNQKGAYGAQHVEKVGPIWVDRDIYPEHQRSMVYDTQLYSKGVPIAGSLIPFLNRGIARGADDKGTLQGGHEIAWRMTTHALKMTIYDMYQGELIVVGDPSVKPHDRMYIYDGYENMSGSALVEGVVHNFSAENGYTTTIYPDCIAVHDDRHELVAQSTGAQIASKAILTTLAVMAPSLLFGRTFAPLITASAGKARSILVNARKLGRSLGVSKNFTQKLSKASRVARTASKVGRFTRLGTTVGGAAALSGGTVLIPLAALAIEIGIVQTFSNSASNIFERWMRSQQALQVFPLKKHYKVLTAGLNGSMGLVYGSPTYDTPGTLEKLFTKLNTETNGFNGAVNFMIDMLTTDEMRNIAARFERGENMVEDMDVTVSQTKLIDSVLGSLASEEYRRQAGYRKLLLTQRITEDSSDEKFERAFSDQAFLDTNAIEINPRITNELRYIKSDEKIKEAMGTGLLQTVWDSPLPEQDYESKEFNLNGQKEVVRTVVMKEGSKKIYDIPFLRPDAMEVLKEIIIKCSYLLPEHDLTKEQNPPENFLFLHSALRVGDDETAACLGYSFIIEANGKKEETLLIDAINAIEKEIEELYNEGGGVTAKKLFAWEMAQNENRKRTRAIVTVYPPDNY